MDSIFNFTSDQDKELVEIMEKQLAAFFRDGKQGASAIKPEMIDFNDVKFKQNNGLNEMSLDVVKQRLLIVIQYMKSWSSCTKFIDNAQVHVEGSLANDIFKTKHLVPGPILDNIT
jgi:hypothetical protein